MRTKEHVKREILAAIDGRAEQIVSLGAAGASAWSMAAAASA